MKKLFTILAVMTAVTVGVNAQRLMDESFDYKEGNLASKSSVDDAPVTTTEWFYTGGATDAKIQVVDTSLSKEGYMGTSKGNAVKIATKTDKAVRAFSKVSSGSAYCGVLVNVQQLRSSTTKDYFICLTEGTTTANKNFAQLKFLNNYNDGTFQVGISKAGESWYRMWNTKLKTDSTYLLVMRYDFIEGDNNDEVRLWVNPTKMDESKPTLVCVQDTFNTSQDNKGAASKADASYLSWVYLKPGNNTPTNVIVDELRVTTKWADLFEGGGTEPYISVSSSELNLGTPYQGESVTKSLNITGQALKANVSISHKHKDISLSASSFTKEAVEKGVTLDVTLNANETGYQYDTIVITSDTIVKNVVVSWYTGEVISCANIAAVKDAFGSAEEGEVVVRLTGEAIVTRDTVISSVRELYIQDASGATKIIDSNNKLGSDNQVGAKIKNFVATNKGYSFGINPLVPATAPEVVSTGNKVEPQEVSLADLQANAVDYLLELVKIKGVAFADAGESFAVGQYAISQATDNAKIKVENNNIVGKVIPAKAHVIGFSFNTSGSVILPRNIDDIIDANPVLLKNGSFEKWKVESAGFLGTNTEFEGWSVSKITFGAKVVDSTNVLDGKYAFKTTSDLKQAGAYLYQEINCQDYAQGDEFKVRIGYKNLNDSVLSLASYWETSMGSTEEMKQGAVKQVLPSSKSDYNIVEVNTIKPEGARYFVYKVAIPYKAQVLIDNCAFTYVEPTPTAVEESSKSANSSKCVKVIRNGQLLIIRDGVIYNIAGQKL